MAEELMGFSRRKNSECLKVHPSRL